MILAAEEKLESLSAIIKNDWFPKPNGRPISHNTIKLWATVGVRGAVLETVFVGACACTSKSRVEKFFAAITKSQRSRANDRKNAPQSDKQSKGRHGIEVDRRGVKAGHRA